MESANAMQDVIGVWREHHDYNNYLKFANAEHLTRVIGADALTADEKITALDVDGAVNEYKITQLQTKHAGVVGYVLTADQNNKIHIVFRGTCNMAAVLRNLEPGGAGSQSFQDNSPLMMSQIAQIIGEHATKVSGKISLSISGHSLGGADAQNCAAAIMQEMVTAYGEDKKFPKAESSTVSTINAWMQINKLTVNHLNSAGITHAVAAKGLTNAQYLAAQGLDINVRALRVEHDALQQTGQASLLANVPKNIARVEVLKISINPGSLVDYLELFLVWARLPRIISRIIHAGYATYAAHTNTHFMQNFHPENFRFFNNEHDLKIVAKELSHTTMLGDNLITNKLKQGMYFIFKFAISTSVPQPDTEPMLDATCDQETRNGTQNHPSLAIA